MISSTPNTPTLYKKPKLEEDAIEDLFSGWQTNSILKGSDFYRFNYLRSVLNLINQDQSELFRGKDIDLDVYSNETPLSCRGMQTQSFAKQQTHNRSGHDPVKLERET